MFDLKTITTVKPSPIAAHRASDPTGSCRGWSAHVKTDLRSLFGPCWTPGVLALQASSLLEEPRGRGKSGRLRLEPL